MVLKVSISKWENLHPLIHEFSSDKLRKDFLSLKLISKPLYEKVEQISL